MHERNRSGGGKKYSKFKFEAPDLEFFYNTLHTIFLNIKTNILELYC